MQPQSVPDKEYIHLIDSSTVHCKLQLDASSLRYHCVPHRLLVRDGWFLPAR